MQAGERPSERRGARCPEREEMKNALSEPRGSREFLRMHDVNAQLSAFIPSGHLQEPTRFFRFYVIDMSSAHYITRLTNQAQPLSPFVTTAHCPPVRLP